MVPVKRKEEILGFIQQRKICSIAELAGRFSVSRVTIHRVLNELESEDLVTKVHGGVRASQDFFFKRGNNPLWDGSPPTDRKWTFFKRWQ